MAAVQQIKKIYAIGQSLGIVDRAAADDDDLHQLVQAITGKDSVKALSQAEAANVIAELQRRQGKAPAPKTKQEDAIPGMMSPGMKRKAWALVYALAAHDKTPSAAQANQRLSGILKKDFHMDVPLSDPLRWISFKDGNKLIETLKKYVANAARKAGGSG